MGTKVLRRRKPSCPTAQIEPVLKGQEKALRILVGARGDKVAVLKDFGGAVFATRTLATENCNFHFPIRVSPAFVDLPWESDLRWPPSGGLLP